MAERACKRTFRLFFTSCLYFRAFSLIYNDVPRILFFSKYTLLSLRPVYWGSGPDPAAGTYAALIGVVDLPRWIGVYRSLRTFQCAADSHRRMPGPAFPSVSFCWWPNLMLTEV